MWCELAPGVERPRQGTGARAVADAHFEVELVDRAAEAGVERLADGRVLRAERIGARAGNRLFGRVGQKNRAGHFPVRPFRLASGFQGGRFVGPPGVGHDVARHETVRQRLVTAECRDFHARRVAAHARHGDRRMRLCSGFGM